ncbi:MAG TPA: valine--tRNA ligase, partial [Alicyclobacillus sp.]|nr:valine--tRNA ligase [Alicyclobacillus sp.]
QEALRDFEGGEVYLRRLAGIDPLDFDLHAVPPSKSVTEVLGRAELFIPLEGVVDLEGEIRRLEKELEQLGKEVDRVRAKLDNPSFVAKAPPAVVEEQRRKEVDYATRRERVQARLESLQRMI